MLKVKCNGKGICNPKSFCIFLKKPSSMKSIFIFLFSLSSIACFAQLTVELKGEPIIFSSSDQFGKEVFKRFDTTVGYVSYPTKYGIMWDECIKIDSICEYEYEAWNDCNKSTRIGAGLYTTTLLGCPPTVKKAEKGYVKRIVLLRRNIGYEVYYVDLNISKPYTFYFQKDLNE